MDKGTFSLGMGIIVSLVLAFIALILIWYFHEKIFAVFSGLLLEGLKGYMCSLIHVPFICG
ncbi:MAG: hypothetical protein HYW23_03870 [Candidatus Aenigmarchaeota archaeon]|nr:hypothetical protein [Candidatus Aenigmarchaeota archaeon]